MKRLNYLDISKGFAMLLVVFAHICADNTDSVVIWIYSFHMPMFFIISGCILNYKYNKVNFSIKEQIKSKLYSLMIPYLAFSFFSILIRIILYKGNLSVMYSDLINTIKLLGIETLWFLPCIFFAETIFFIMVIKQKKCKDKDFVNSFDVYYS